MPRKLKPEPLPPAQWMQRPSQPGLWLYRISEVSRWQRHSYAALILDQESIDRGAPFGVEEVYGPIPLSELGQKLHLKDLKNQARYEAKRAAKQQSKE